MWATRSEQSVDKAHPKHKGNHPITQIDQDGNEIMTWFNIKDAADHFKIHKSNFNLVCRNGNNLAGFKWKFATEDIEGEIWKEVSVAAYKNYEKFLISNKGRFKRMNGKIGFGSKTVFGYKI